MSDIIREAPLGQLIRWVTGNKFLKYPEEEADFQCPKCYRDPESTDSLSTIEEKNTDTEASGSAPRIEAGDSDDKELNSLPLNNDADHHHELEDLQTQKTNVTARSDIDQHDIEKLHTLKTHVTVRSSIDGPPTLTRTKTRDMTRAYTRERLDIEKEERSLKELNIPIIVQKNEDGDVLVDWYSTDDPANPQNWSSKKKAFVGLQIL